MFRTILPPVLLLYRANGYPEEVLAIHPDGRPPSFAGDYYYSLHPGAIRPGPIQQSAEWGLDELFHFHVTISQKTGIHPSDKLAAPLLNSLPLEGMYAHERKLKSLISNNWPTLICQMNAALLDLSTDDANYKFRVMTIRWTGTSDPQPQGPDWFGSDPDSYNPMVGTSITLDFGPIRRVQSELAYPIV